MIEKIKNYLKNKSIGYYLVAGAVLLAIIFTIIFFATYKMAEANNAVAYAPQTIGVYMIGAIVVEIIALCFPQYRLIHIAGVVLISLSLFKEVFLIPNLIADKINNVKFQKGDLPTQIVWLVMQLIIVGLAIAASFIGFYKDEADVKKDMAVKKDVPHLACYGGSAVLLVAAILSTTLISTDLEAKANAAYGSKDPITKAIRQACDEFEYDEDPTSVLIKEQEKYNFDDAELKALSFKKDKKREGHFLVYFFEGAYSEGYQGQYNEYYSYIELWDDGLYAGQSNGSDFKGFWYNSSLQEGKAVNAETGEEEDIIDCVNMVGSSGNFESIITEPSQGFYQRSAYIYMNPGWGGRSMVVNGYMYYPECALFVDVNNAPTKFYVGETFNRSSWTAMRVLKNYNYSSVFIRDEVKWTDPEGMVDKDGVLLEAGTYEIEASWNGLTATQEITVYNPKK